MSFVAIVTGCNADDCYRIAESGSLGAFLVGGDGLAKAYMICDTLRPPPAQPEAIGDEGGACAPAGSDDVCLGCVKRACCEVAVQCVEERSCACLIACRSAGEGESRCVAEVCGEASLDAEYDAAVSCVTQHCSAECPHLSP
ncbi:Hypothetical protein A7982_07862 [Minicystis rosea]|nr:Hypothetical protein A7982_07862 [Minicystis rosea]